MEAMAGDSGKSDLNGGEDVFWKALLALGPRRLSLCVVGRRGDDNSGVGEGFVEYKGNGSSGLCEPGLSRALESGSDNLESSRSSVGQLQPPLKRKLYPSLTNPIEGGRGQRLHVKRPISIRTPGSLHHLCKRFLEIANKINLDGPDKDIQLNDMSEKLGVTTRRVYDIVNILESVEVVKRRGRNAYEWMGHAKLQEIMTKLKTLAFVIKFDDYCCSVLSNTKTESSNVHKLKCLSSSDSTKSVGEAVGASSPIDHHTIGIMSQKFIMLMLHCEGRGVRANSAAKILLGEPDGMNNCKYKTKVRRLYDIASVFINLKLIKKQSEMKSDGRQLYKYSGPPAEIITNRNAFIDMVRRTDYTTKHSLMPAMRDMYNRSAEIPIYDVSSGAVLRGLDWVVAGLNPLFASRSNAERVVSAGHAGTGSQPII